MYTSIYWLYMYKGHSPINFTKKINDPSYCRYLCNTVLIHLEKGIYKADTKQLMPVVHKNFPLWELIERELCTAFSGHIMGLGERDGWSVQESLVWLWVDTRKMNRSYICVMELKTTTSQDTAMCKGCGVGESLMNLQNLKYEAEPLRESKVGENRWKSINISPFRQ